MKILVTAFDPFGGESINPALEAVKLMKDKSEFFYKILIKPEM